MPEFLLNVSIFFNIPCTYPFVYIYDAKNTEKNKKEFLYNNEYTCVTPKHQGRASLEIYIKYIFFFVFKICVLWGYTTALYVEFGGSRGGTKALEGGE